MCGDKLDEAVYLSNWYPTFCVTFYLMTHIFEASYSCLCEPIRAWEITGIRLLNELYTTESIDPVFDGREGK